MSQASRPRRSSVRGIGDEFGVCGGVGEEDGTGDGFEGGVDGGSFTVLGASSDVISSGGDQENKL